MKSTIIGFGSLLSIESAKSSFKTLANFRFGLVKNYRRVFRHSAPIFVQRNIANLETKEQSSLSAEKYKNIHLIVSVFEIDESEMKLFYDRELEFKWETVYYEPFGFKVDSDSNRLSGIMCVGFENEKEFRETRFKSDDIFHNTFGKYGINKVWRNDIYPCRIYLRHCVLACRNADKMYFSNKK